MINSKYSSVVIGSGIAGLYTALKLEQYTKKEVLLVTKSELHSSNSYYAQGGMVAVLKENVNDSVDLHVQDTLNAGAGLSEVETVRFISENSNDVVKDLLKFGVNFDSSDGHFTLTKEAAHSIRRILHCGGDATGREMELALCSAVENNQNIKIAQNTIVTEILTDDNVCKGVTVLNQDGYKTILADAVIVATGGIGQLYKYTTNPIGATGDGIALCYNAGAVLRDMEFVQFHPTALAIDDVENHNRFLISEAVRGEGAKLCDKDRNYYMKNYDAREELAPRDIVARANFSQMNKTGEDCVYIDTSTIPKDKLLNRFPNIAKKCSQFGIDITKDLIPVAPVAHYFMGGVRTDLNGETSVKNLYAVGEVSSTGLHGANRLASNSLLECVVCAYKVAEHIASVNEISQAGENAYFERGNVDFENTRNTMDIKQAKQKIQNIMWDNVGIYRSKESLIYAINEISDIKRGLQNPQNKEEYELLNMAVTALLISESALYREESRGAHYRTDFEQTDDIAYHSEITRDREIVKKYIKENFCVK